MIVIVCSIGCKMWISLLGRLIWMWNYRAKCLFIQYLIYLFVSMFADAIVLAYRVRVIKKKKKRKKKNKTKKKKTTTKKQTKNKKKKTQKKHVTLQVQWKSERVPDKTALRVCFPFAKILLKLCRMHMHMLIWNFVDHMFPWTPSHISCKSFSTVKTQRPWSDCADAHACICWSRTSPVRCFLGITLYFI